MVRRSDNYHCPADGGFTAIEVMAVLLIMSICAVLGMDLIADIEATQRANRAACEALAFFRYARHQAMVTGKSAKVQINTSNGTFAVYWMSNGTAWDANPVSQSMTGGGLMQITLNSQQELQGATMSVIPSGTTEFVYGPFGSTVSDSTTTTEALSGSVTFSYGGKSKILTIPAAGDMQIN